MMLRPNSSILHVATTPSTSTCDILCLLSPVGINKRIAVSADIASSPESYNALLMWCILYIQEDVQTMYTGQDYTPVRMTSLSRSSLQQNEPATGQPVVVSSKFSHVVGSTVDGSCTSAEYRRSAGRYRSGKVCQIPW
jgi:hypothetical protein